MADADSWSTLLQELLGAILARLDLADHIRFSSVCKHWGTAAASANTAQNKPLGLVYSKRPHHLLRTLLTSLPIPWQWDSASCVGSYEGWLVLQFDKEQLLLLNPATRAQIILPCLELLRDHIKKAVLSSSPESDSAGDCLIVVKTGTCGLAFCKPGDTAWTEFYELDLSNIGNLFHDIMFFKHQLFVTFLDGSVKVYNSSLTSNTTCCFRDLPQSSIPYLVNVSDRLLLLHTVLNNSSWKLKMYEIDQTRGTNCVEVKSIGDQIILQCPLCCFSVPVKDHPDIQQKYANLYDLSNVFYEGIPLEEKHVRPGTIGKKVPVFFALFNDDIDNM